MSQFRKNSRIQYSVHKLYEKISCYVASCNVGLMTQAVTIFKLWHASVYFLLQAWYFLLQEKVMTQIISIYLHSPTIYTFTKFDCSSKYSEVIIMYLLFFAFTLFSIRLTLKTKIVNLFKKGSMRDDNLPLQKISMHLLSESIMVFFSIK